MKHKLFGQLGDKLKGNGLILFLVAAVAFAGVFTYRTVQGINKRLENQQLQNIETTPSTAHRRSAGRTAGTAKCSTACKTNYTTATTAEHTDRT